MYTIRTVKKRIQLMTQNLLFKSDVSKRIDSATNKVIYI